MGATYRMSLIFCPYKVRLLHIIKPPEATLKLCSMYTELYSTGGTTGMTNFDRKAKRLAFLLKIWLFAGGLSVDGLPEPREPRSEVA